MTGIQGLCGEKICAGCGVRGGRGTRGVSACRCRGGHVTDIHRRTVGEADMQLDFAEQPVLMFRNTGGSHRNLVYSRPYSHMGWINLVMESYGQEP